MKYLLFVALGGAAGALGRHLLANWVHTLWVTTLPLGTLLVNLLGSLAIGVVYVVLMEKQLVHPDWRGVMMVGFLGAFTTFSTYSLETVRLIESGQGMYAIAYMFGSAVVCVAGAAGAITLTRAVL